MTVLHLNELSVLLSIEMQTCKNLKSLGGVTIVNKSNYNREPLPFSTTEKISPFSLCHVDGLKQLLERDMSTGLV